MKSGREECCFKACCSPDHEEALTFEVFSAADDPSLLKAHDRCFAERRHPGVSFDNPTEHGHVPNHARCAFCGDPLPLIGKHPYCFDAGAFFPPHRYWAHSGCMKAVLTAASMAKLLK